MRVIGAGLGRTGTVSLKLALEQLTGGRCYHMTEVTDRPDHVPVWAAAARGEAVDWHALFEGFQAAVDWPAAGFWRQIAEAYPDAVIVLSTRESARRWWESADRTVFALLQEPPPPERAAQRAMVRDVLSATFTPDWRDREAAIRAYERHNAQVRSEAPEARLLGWQPGDGWGPLCRALGVPVPAEPFPHLNTTGQFREMVGLDPPASG